MKNKINFLIYSGSYNVNTLGATKSIDTMLVKNIRKMDYEVLWVGRGKISSSIYQYINIGNGDILELLIRIFQKIQRVFFKISPSSQTLNEFIYYDKRLANKIKKGEIKIDASTVFIGRNGMSLLSLLEIKKRGGMTVLHSQWMHPISQNNYLTAEYKKLGLNYSPILPARIERQLKEIDIVDKIWCISSLVERSFINNGIEKNRLLSCSLGVDYHSIDHRIALKSDVFNILFVGNVNFEKGIHILLESVLNLSFNKKICIILNGYVDSRFKFLLNQYADKYEKMGISLEIQPGDPFKNFSRASIFVLPSIHESFGLVVLEAMASGLPVIVSDNVGAKDCVKDGSNGYIFQRGSSTDLTSLIQKFINDPSLVLKMGNESLRISKNYNWPVVASSLISLISKK